MPNLHTSLSQRLGTARHIGVISGNAARVERGLLDGYLFKTHLPYNATKQPFVVVPQTCCARLLRTATSAVFPGLTDSKEGLRLEV